MRYISSLKWTKNIFKLKKKKMQLGWNNDHNDDDDDGGGDAVFDFTTFYL